MRQVLLLAEHLAGIPTPTTLAMVSAAAQLGDIVAVVADEQAECAAVQLATLRGVTRVLVARAGAAVLHMPEDMARLATRLVREHGCTHVVGGATAFGRAVTPRVAALLDVGQVSDVMSIEDEATFVRSIYAGNVVIRVRCNDSIRVLTVRPSAFFPAQERDTAGSADIEQVDAGAPDARVRLSSRTSSASERPQLLGARVIVSGGRGMGSSCNFKLLDPIADKLGAAIGASRAAVDAGYVSNDCQVGQTGKCVAPDLYIAIGISGAIQHLAGMKDSKCIVAVNKDPEAPIFSVADYGIVADLFEILPQLERELDAYITVGASA